MIGSVPESDQRRGEDRKKGVSNPTGPSGRVISFVVRVLVWFFVVSSGVVLLLRWVPPPTGSVMIQRSVERLWNPKSPAVHYRWARWKSISPNLPLAVVAAEDQKFPYHWGFDVESIRKAIDKSRDGGRLRGASTITQQTAKNLFLWSGRSWVRKGLEAYFAVLLELFWSKRRILEVYVNIAEFGDGVFGAHAASTRLLGKSPERLTKRDAALLAACLPNPKRLRAARPSRYVRSRRAWIQRQMNLLGGVSYLDGIAPVR